MARLSAIVPICILISSCSLHDTGEVSNEEAPAAPPAVLEQAPPAGPEEQTAPRPLPPPVRVITVDNVRRLQTRLREVGLDSGPVDGVPGAKTKLAFNRLQAGCAKLERLRVEHPLVREQGGSAGGKIPARDEVTQIQAELRAAGFNPGPIDGIYGARTKALVARLPAACVAAKEFPGGLDDAADQTKLASRGTIDPSKTLKPMPAIRSDEPPRETASVQSVQPREDVRVLQLRLRDAGFDPGPFDGIMGAKTRAALAQYEASQRNGKIKTSLTTNRISGQY